MEPPAFHDAVPPERSRSLDSRGIRLRLHEWGDPAGPPLVLCHGMFDHGRGFDRLAPRLAVRFRVVALDARGHGDSDWAESYTWPADLADVLNVARSLGRPVCLVGHSKGGGQATDAAILAGRLVRQVVNIDGFGPPPGGHRRFAEEGTMPERFAVHLDRRRAAAEQRAWRTYASLDDLVERRAEQNPRLSREWLRYFVYHGARQVDGGWQWKVDPLAGHGFGPWRPEWIGPSFQQLRVPMLAVVGSEPDAWGPLPEELLAPRLAHVPHLERAVVRGAGHFVHMERPAETADLLLAFLEAR